MQIQVSTNSLESLPHRILDSDLPPYPMYPPKLRGEVSILVDLFTKSGGTSFLYVLRSQLRAGNCQYLLITKEYADHCGTTLRGAIAMWSDLKSPGGELSMHLFRSIHRNMPVEARELAEG